MSKLRWKKSHTGKPHDDFRDNGHRPADQLQRKADAAFKAWYNKLPRPEVIREQAALNEVAPDQVELLVALIGRRLSSQEGSL